MRAMATSISSDGVTAPRSRKATTSRAANFTSSCIARSSPGKRSRTRCHRDALAPHVLDDRLGAGVAFAGELLGALGQRGQLLPQPRPFLYRRLLGPLQVGEGFA